MIIKSLKIILKSLHNDIKLIFNLNLKESIYIGSFNNELKEGNGILFINNKKNYFQNYTIFEGEFKNDKKYKGKLFLNDKICFYCFWKDDEIIDDTEIGILNINNSIKLYKKLNTIQWMNLIEKEKNNYFGNKNINIPIDLIIK